MFEGLLHVVSSTDILFLSGLFLRIETTLATVVWTNDYDLRPYSFFHMHQRLLLGISLVFFCSFFSLSKLGRIGHEILRSMFWRWVERGWGGREVVSKESVTVIYVGGFFLLPYSA